ncbi:dihydroxyacetone kinase subunit DhaK [Aquincola sp. S2]|uniref:Dihydroxyacetone kinase subunit DhaK n=1 Tax=Pseudaquabacterium terrae TaxID=2732868 RepID=A0ABX2EFS6_9BURK|nr:dihydroxyacetone kinase subunit DhaK [Aquabacterium terrae]NRF67462.1 dihydroxyacetone kinase subunit DhaK [Aquabacterium terrae]
MKKFLNSSDDLVADSVAGLVMAHEELLALNESPLFVCRRTPKKKRVALISGGGSGHEPLHTGYVGPGMLDAACPGEVFTAPTPDQIVAAAKRVDAGQGVLMIVKNYAGDCASFQVATDMLDVDCATVLVNDDVAVDSSTRTPGRRGVAGTLVVEKMLGAAAEAGADLYECKALGARVNSNTASMGVALTSCIVPEAAAPTFEIGPSEIEVGVGIHGEPGRYRRSLLPADDIVTLLLEPILKDLALATGREVLLHVNGFGGTPLIELHLLNKVATQRLREHGLVIRRWLVGNHTSSLEMAGASLTLTALDDELLGLWDAPVLTPSLRW